MTELLQYSFFQHALLGSLLTAVACGIVGTYIVARRLVFISGGITHASFGGLGLGFYLGMNPIGMAMVFAVLSAFGVEWASRSQSVREDSAIAAVWSLGMALGVIFIFLTPGYAPNLTAYLFGNILTITQGDLVAITLLAIALVVLFGLFLREIVYVAFDREYATSQNIPTRTVSYVMAAIIAVTIVLSIRAMGIILLISLLTMPAVIVNCISKSYRTISIWAAVVGAVANVTGLVISYYCEIPPSVVIIFVLTFAFIVVKLLPLYRKTKFAVNR